MCNVLENNFAFIFYYLRMRKLLIRTSAILLALPFLFATSLKAATWTDSSPTLTYISGKVGIGVTSASDDLVVKNGTYTTAKIGDGRGSWWFNANSYSDGNGYNNITNNAYYDGGWKRLETGSESWFLGSFVTATSPGTGSFRIMHANPQSGATNITNLAALFEVSANGKVYASEIVVTAAANWPDYVFASDYKLMPLNEVAKYIKANNHLPNVPTAEEIGKGGIAVGEMQKVQMQKIEELTLYTVQLKQENDDLKARMDTLEAKLNQLLK